MNLLPLLLPLVVLQQITVVIPPKKPLGKNVAFVVDVSGSMEGGALAEARSFVVSTAAANTDELNVQLYTFAGHTARFSKEWARLPDANATTAMDSWLGTQHADGPTLCSKALEAAFALEVRELSVVLVTDGMVADLVYVAGWIEERQRARVAKGLDPVTIFIYQTEKTSKSYEDRLHLLVEKTGGGWFRPKEKKEDDDE